MTGSDHARTYDVGCGAGADVLGAAALGRAGPQIGGLWFCLGSKWKPQTLRHSVEALFQVEILGQYARLVGPEP